MPISTNILNTIITIFTICGGALFTIGSVTYLPSINSSIGGVLFILGSVFYFMCDIIGVKLEPEFSPWKPCDNVGGLRALLVAIGNVAFVVGSVYFLP